MNIRQILERVDEEVGRATALGQVHEESILVEDVHSTPQFAHLHVHSHYSLLDGLSKPVDIVKRVKELGCTAVAITDHGSISAMPDFFKAAKEHDIKPLMGCEFYIGDKRNHLNVIAKSWAGVESLIKKLTLANKQFLKRPILTWEQALDFNECIVLSACCAGMLSQPDYLCLAESFKTKYQDDFYLEIMPISIIEDGVDIQKTVNERAIRLNKELGFKLVATCDSHYTYKDDRLTHEILLAIQTKTKWDNPKRWKFNCYAYLESYQELVADFRRLGYIPDDIVFGALAETVNVANKVDIRQPDHKVYLPSVNKSSFPGFADDDLMKKDLELFMKKIMDGWKKFVVGKVAPEKMPTYRARLEEEVKVIRDLGFVRYFLIVEDFIAYARSRNILVGPGRGSAAGSLVCWLIGITQLDPIEHELYFERFLNKARVSMPDIDVDFQDDRRKEVIDYIRNKYGMDQTAQIGTFSYLSAKSAFRDIASTFGINSTEVNRLSKLIDDEDSFDGVSDLQTFTSKNPVVIEQAKKLSGTIRAVGTHAAGVIVSDKHIDDVAVIESRRGTEVCNWAKDEAEHMGLLKVDILGISTLTVINKACELILENRGELIDLASIPLNDRATLKMLADGHGIGVFQMENSGMRRLLQRLKVDRFEHIVATTALYRPGPLVAGLTEKYVKVASGIEYPKYLHEDLKPALRETYSVIVFQEQIARVFVDLGGFTMTEADQMRKIIGKKLGDDEFGKHKAHFVDGCVKNGVSEEAASQLFDQMKEFAKYAFNKSHAAAYSMVTMWNAYLKCHYPVEFWAAMLSCTTKTAKIPRYIKECRRMNINVRMPDVNLSQAQYSIHGGEIIAPLGIIKGVGDKALAAIMEARQDGPFKSYDDFFNRVNKRTVNKGVQDKLVRAGAFESLGLIERDENKRRHNFFDLLPIYDGLPSLTLEHALDMQALTELMAEVKECASANLLTPKRGSKNTPIMIINKFMKGEKKLLSKENTKFILTELESMGIDREWIYYTSPVKCFTADAKHTKECERKCQDFLKKEILAVKPKLIICCASSVTGMFVDDKSGMEELQGSVVYNSFYDCFVLFAWSPQYATYKEQILEPFQSAMKKVGEIFLGESGGEKDEEDEDFAE